MNKMLCYKLWPTYIRQEIGVAQNELLFFHRFWVLFFWLPNSYNYIMIWDMKMKWLWIMISFVFFLRIVSTFSIQPSFSFVCVGSLIIGVDLDFISASNVVQVITKIRFLFFKLETTWNVKCVSNKHDIVWDQGWVHNISQFHSQSFNILLITL